jgi:hypothetical protein
MSDMRPIPAGSGSGRNRQVFARSGRWNFPDVRRNVAKNRAIIPDKFPGQPY